MRDYLASLKKLLALNLTALLPGHGPVIRDPHAKIREYIDHRLARESQLLDLIGKNFHAAQDLVREVYRDVPRALHSVALMTVEAHLIKLVEDGRVARNGKDTFVLA
jgi:hydroxyacylglutathione hydrolase